MVYVLSGFVVFLEFCCLVCVCFFSICSLSSSHSFPVSNSHLYSILSRCLQFPLTSALYIQSLSHYLPAMHYWPTRRNLQSSWKCSRFSSESLRLAHFYLHSSLLVFVYLSFSFLFYPFHVCLHP